MHTVTALLCFVVVIHWLIFPYPSGLLHWHCGNLTIAPVPAKQPWWIWINTSCEFIMNDCITTTKQSTTDRVHISWDILYLISSVWPAAGTVLVIHSDVLLLSSIVLIWFRYFVTDWVRLVTMATKSPDSPRHFENYSENWSPLIRISSSVSIMLHAYCQSY